MPQTIINLGNASTTTDLIAAIAQANPSPCTNHTIINLPAGKVYTLLSSNNTFFGATGLPVIRCEVTINGDATQIIRDTAAPQFRILGVENPGILRLNGIEVRNGYATTVGGGGILNVFGGQVYLFNSVIEGNTTADAGPAQTIGGGVYSYEGALYVESSRIANNRNLSVTGDGGGIGIINAVTSIVTSDITNNSTTRDGGGVALLFAGIPNVNDSCLTSNTQVDMSGTVLASNGLYANQGTTDATRNWWGIDDGPSGLGSGTGDAVLGNNITFIPYASELIACGVGAPTPTPTPTATPTPQPCTSGTDDVGSIANGPVRFYIQPSLDPESYLFEISNGNLPGRTTTIPANRPYLWSPAAQPASLTVNTIDLIARVGNIGWVDPEVEWYQAQVNNTYTGYIPRTTTNGTQILGLRCTNPTGLGAPLPDAGIPNVPALTVFSPPSARLFDSNQSPAVMGACGIHIGASNPCVPNANGSTIDLVPRNHEFCIDTRNANLLVQCDPGFSSPIDTNLIPVPPRVPMFAPAGGCATFDNNPAQVIIRLFRPSGPGGQTECNTPVQNGDLLIVLTHLTNSPIVATPNRQPINAGDLVGYLCLHAGNEAFNVCGVFQPTIPTHLAFQLQVFNGQFQQVPADILPYTSRMGCLYDNWAYNQGNPQIQLSPIRGCP